MIFPSFPHPQNPRAVFEGDKRGKPVEIIPFYPRTWKSKKKLSPLLWEKPRVLRSFLFIFIGGIGKNMC